MTNARDRMKALVDELIATRRDRVRLREDEEAVEKLGKPCSPTEIGTLERRVGKPLPPTYRAFLEAHNGWEEFEGDFKILAVEDHDVPWVKGRIEELSGFFRTMTPEDPLTTWAFVIAIGETSGRLAVLDKRTKDDAGEMEVVTFEYTNQEYRFPTFADFLEHELEIERDIVKDLREGTEEGDQAS